MITNMSQKEQLLDLLLITQERGGRAFSRLLRRGMSKEAKKVRSKNKKLMSKIERLWIDIANDWNGTAKVKVAELKAMNANIQRSITGLKKKATRAKRAAKILTLLDDVIALATGF